MRVVGFIYLDVCFLMMFSFALKKCRPFCLMQPCIPVNIVWVSKHNCLLSSRHVGLRPRRRRAGLRRRILGHDGAAPRGGLALHRVHARGDHLSTRQGKRERERVSCVCLLFIYLSIYADIKALVSDEEYSDMIERERGRCYKLGTPEGTETKTIENSSAK